MKYISSTIAIIAIVLSMTSTAFADACSSKARSIASGMGATVISVQSKNDGSGGVVCVAKFQISSPGQPARIITQKFKP